MANGRRELITGPAVNMYGQQPMTEGGWKTGNTIRRWQEVAKSIKITDANGEKMVGAGAGAEFRRNWLEFFGFCRFDRLCTASVVVPKSVTFV